MVMKKASGGEIPSPAGCWEELLDPPDLVSTMAAACSMFSGKEFEPRVFPSRGLNRRKGDVRGWTRRPHLLVARPRGGPHHQQVRPAPGPSPALLWTLSSCQVIRDFSFCFIQFREYFLCNFSETQKQQKTGNWHCGILLIG
jgi:hypothetical protein